MKVFSARGSAPPVFAAVKAYRERTGISVDVTVCGNSCVTGDCAPKDADHGFAVEVLEGGFDLAIAGAESDMDDLESTGAVVAGSRRSIGLRQAAILVPAGNPAGIRGLADLAKPGVRVGVSTIDCLRAVWEDVCGRADCIPEVGANIAVRVTGCMAIIESVIHKKVDAAFGWSSFATMSRGIEAILLPPEHRIVRSTCIAILGRSECPDEARAFVDFLTSEDGYRVFVDHGWVDWKAERLIHA